MWMHTDAYNFTTFNKIVHNDSKFNLKNIKRTTTISISVYGL